MKEPNTVGKQHDAYLREQSADRGSDFYTPVSAIPSGRSQTKDQIDLFEGQPNHGRVTPSTQPHMYSSSWERCTKFREKGCEGIALCSLEGMEISSLELLEPVSQSGKDLSRAPELRGKGIVILFFLSGTGRLKVDNYETSAIYPVLPGHYTVVPPYSSETFLEFRPNQKTAILKIDIRTDLFSGLSGDGVSSEAVTGFLEDIDRNRDDNLMKPIRPRMQIVIHQLAYSSLPYPARTVFCAGMALELIAHVIQDHRRQDRVFIHSSEFHRIEKIKEMLDLNLEKPPSFGELSAKAGMSATRFSRTFRAITGTTPYGYIKDRRMARAMQLLSEGSTSVTDVSYAVGYDSISYFSKIFSNHFGIRPFEFKRNRKQWSGVS
ncbi:MAG: Regulatory protein PchR [Syntrophorhabdaceae bacterium PtaU1.Bin034]|nr:MAG: Regulatory protein PchR [Syntrophorhabdaceae bacterium PtaU1.Bin034]